MDYTKLAYALSQTVPPNTVEVIWRMVEPGYCVLRQGETLVFTAMNGSTRVH